MKMFLILLWFILSLSACSKTQNDIVVGPGNPPPIDTTPKPIVYKVIPLPITGTNILVRNAADLNYLPGDTLLVTQSVESLSIYNITGAKDTPVVLKAAEGVIIGGGWTKSVDIIGKYIKIQDLHIEGKASAVGIRAYYSSDLSFENITIDSASVGIFIKNDALPNDSATYYPNAIIKNISLKNCHVKNTTNEGFYLGNTSDIQNGKKNSPIIGLTVKNCSAENTGWDGFQVTSAQDCNIDSVTVINAGIGLKSAQMSGIAIQDATTGIFTNLNVDGCYGGGLTLFGCGDFVVKNVLLKDVCKTDKTNGVFVDNRYDRGFNLGAKKLTLENVEIQGGNLKARYPLYILNSNSNGAKSAIPGLIKDFIYQPDLWPNKIKDDVGNVHEGGTEG